jgi:hypothetical protein
MKLFKLGIHSLLFGANNKKGEGILEKEVSDLHRGYTSVGIILSGFLQ